jgi:hypothetical protein
MVSPARPGTSTRSSSSSSITPTTPTPSHINIATTTTGMTRSSSTTRKPITPPRRPSLSGHGTPSSSTTNVPQAPATTPRRRRAPPVAKPKISATPTARRTSARAAAAASASSKRKAMSRPVTTREPVSALSATNTTMKKEAGTTASTPTLSSLEVQMDTPLGLDDEMEDDDEDLVPYIGYRVALSTHCMLRISQFITRGADPPTFADRSWSSLDCTSRLLTLNLRKQFQLQSSSPPLSLISSDTEMKEMISLASSQLTSRHAMSSRKFRRWVSHEMFYSSIDRPYFVQNEFHLCLQEAQLGHVKKMTRKRWAHARAIMGKAR